MQGLLGSILAPEDGLESIPHTVATEVTPGERVVTPMISSSRNIPRSKQYQTRQGWFLKGCLSQGLEYSGSLRTYSGLWPRRWAPRSTPCPATLTANTCYRALPLYCI